MIVIEASERSGALITANMALEQNREVFAVPGPINSPKSEGTNSLIKDGATVVTSIEDVVSALSPYFSNEVETKIPAEIPELEIDEQEILNALSNDPSHVDVIAADTQKSTANVLATLLTLELMNLVKQLPGKMFIRL